MGKSHLFCCAAQYKLVVGWASYKLRIVARRVGFTCEISSSARLVSTFATFGCSVTRIFSQMAIERSYRGAAVSYCPCERATVNEGVAIALRRQLHGDEAGCTRNLSDNNGLFFAATSFAMPRFPAVGLLEVFTSYACSLQTANSCKYVDRGSRRASDVDGRAQTPNEPQTQPQ